MTWAQASRWARVGVLGGSFDPPHCGHVLLATYALSVAPIDGVLIVPAFAHPFGKQMAPFEQRLAMARAAFGVLAASRVAVCDVEAELAPPSYTWRTLERLAEHLPSAGFRLLVGSDIVRDTAKWSRFDRVRELAPLFVIGRSGHDAPDAESAPLDLPEVSSTEVRRRIRAGEPIDGLVPDVVARLIAREGLYRGERP
ncbi:MAG: nicotinate-nucleotide adenylyltransferase [Sandaracinaceae bacterium]